MKLCSTIALVVLLLLTAACQKESSRAPSELPEQKAVLPADDSLQESGQMGSGRSSARPRAVAAQGVPSDVPALQQGLNSTQRMVVQTAQITIESDDPSQLQQKLVSIAQAARGFVVTSEFKQGTQPNQLTQTVSVVVRVPPDQFATAMEQIRLAGERVIQEKVSGQDLTEEFIDLEARLKAKIALEAQFIEIMKQARRVQDALDVQKEITEVRTQIEQIEGRKRFIASQAELSTITATIQTPAPVVVATAGGIGANLKDAFGDGVDTAVVIIQGLVRIILVMIPITLLILLPLYLISRLVIRRLNWNAKPSSIVSSQ